jgi:septal ring factor EnvC (AmiA/AmiB activator)
MPVSPGSSGPVPSQPDAQARLNRKVQALEKQVEILTAQLKEQAAQIQKVSAQLEVNKPAPQVVVNKP